MSEVKKTGLELLREPFPAHQIGKLAKGSKAQTQCPASEKANCSVCGGWHHPKMIHLDYVGHAALTDRLLDADPMWSWEPLALKDGLPAFDPSGGLWIKLTVCGVTRLGYGNAPESEYKEIGSREKEVIGDALRNAAMRFGAALELWHKGDLHVDEETPQKQKQETKPRLPTLTPEQDEAEYKKWMEIKSLLVDEDGAEIPERVEKEWFKLASNVRTGIKRHGAFLKAEEERKAQEELDKQAGHALAAHIGKEE